MSTHLRVAIVHYHLKRGGVTRVIESTLRGLKQSSSKAPVSSVVLAGEVPEDFPYLEQAHTVEGLHYSNSQANTPDPETLLEQLRITAGKALGGEPDLWHIHNHSLGKNEAMPGVVSSLLRLARHSYSRFMISLKMAAQATTAVISKTADSSTNSTRWANVSIMD